MRAPWYLRGPLWRLRFWRWPHHKHSAGHHRWRDRGEQDTYAGRRRVFVCERCGGEALCWPLDVRSPLLHRGDRVVA